MPVTARTSLPWSEQAIEMACDLAEQWYRGLPPFPKRVNLGSVVGRKYPAIVSEQDCVINFARFLNEAGVPWDAIHHQLSISRWLFDSPHPAATAMTPGEKKWRVDLALLRSDDFLDADLPAHQIGFQFDAFLEFKYLSDYWLLPGAQVFNHDPEGGRNSVQADVKKIGRYLERSVCRFGYVIVFEQCDWGFADTFAADTEAQHHGCRVRFIRNHPVVSSSQGKATGDVKKDRAERHEPSLRARLFLRFWTEFLDRASQGQDSALHERLGNRPQRDRSESRQARARPLRVASQT